jgi:PBP1b-binding outer membrane lipoprotein LpoB
MTRSFRNVAMPVGVVALLLACSACSKPEPPKKDQPPEPQAQTAPVETHTELRDAIQAPINRAKAVEPEVLDAAKKQQDDIDAQASGG